VNCFQVNDQRKRQLPEDLRRDPLKKTKDMAQAELIEQLVRECLPHLKRLPGQL
jgi:hypothetical protein